MKTNLLILVAITVTLFSCQKTILEKTETKADYLQRVFSEETGKQQYYTEKFLEALSKSDSKLRKAYLDSCMMANYCTHRAFKDMYGK